MIEVKPFKLDMLRTNEFFYCLHHIKNVNEIDVFHKTPSGYIRFDKVQAFSMPNGQIIVTASNPIHLASLYNLVVVSGGIEEIVSTNSIERVIKIYDKQSNSNFGVFSFTSSNIVLEPNIDWRCDTGKYGPGAFPPNSKLIAKPEDITIFEPVLSVVGSAHLVYLESGRGASMADEHFNNAEKQAIGRTFWECLKVIREWSIVGQEPFNNTESMAVKAVNFMDSLKFSQAELDSIDGQADMQIAKYILGDNNARQRPENLLEMNEDIKNLLFRRLSSGTLSAIAYLNPGMWNVNELIEAEKEFLNLKRQIFNEKLKDSQLPENYINLQEKLFNNRELIFSKIENGEF